MKPGRWDYFEEALNQSALCVAWALVRRFHASWAVRSVLLLACACASLWPAPTHALAQEPPKADVLLSAAHQPPAEDDPAWAAVAVPDAQEAAVAWYRVEFALPAQGSHDYWMLYVPYFYGGGRIWLNREPLAAVPESSASLRVRWERPLLLSLPASQLRSGVNVLHLRVASAHGASGTRLSQLVVGPQQELQPQFDRRLFLVRTVPLVTVVTGAVMGLFVVGIWLRRRQEVLYGLFGAAALLWALRTTTFVFDTLPAPVWPFWRLLYHASNGGFIIVLALFALNLAGRQRRSVSIGLSVYWLLGPMLYAVSGGRAEEVVGRWWVLGLIPVGISIAVFTLVAAWRQRTLGTVLIAAAVVLAVLSGVHDYLVAWDAPVLHSLAPRWAGHRFFLLHHGANLLLVAMGVLLTIRFVRSLHEVEEANRTLEARVAAREKDIAASYQRIAALQQEQATLDERQRIMQDLHDGLGAQLITSLLRAERGALDAQATAGMLRSAIDEMRIAIEALASDEKDFRTVFGNFRFRWDQRLRDAGVLPDWQVDLPDAVLAVPPHDALQVLHVVQEALTNTLKHARAKKVRITLRLHAGHLVLEVADDGCGIALPAADHHANRASAVPAGSGRGLANMRERVRRLGARLHIGAAQTGGTRVTLELPLPA